MTFSPTTIQGHSFNVNPPSVILKINTLVQDIQSKSQYGQINILLLGESGVGKSTFINSLANYTSYETLQEATQYTDSIKHVIPSYFSLVDDKGYLDIIKIGNMSQNTDFTNSGSSQTQQCGQYQIQMFGLQVNFIDTPGFNDTESGKDEQNLQEILRFLSTYDQPIHQMFILLKPNETKLSQNFRNLWYRLLQVLPQNSLQSISYIFTNSQSTFFQGASTIDQLQVFGKQVNQSHGVQFDVNHRNMYYYDSDAFRYLMLYNRNNFKCLESKVNIYELIWQKSRVQIQKLFNDIKNQTHIFDPQSILRLHDIRQDLQKVAQIIFCIQELKLYHLEPLLQSTETLQMTEDTSKIQQLQQYLDYSKKYLYDQCLNLNIYVEQQSFFKEKNYLQMQIRHLQDKQGLAFEISDCQVLQNQVGNNITDKENFLDAISKNRKQLMEYMQPIKNQAEHRHQLIGVAAANQNLNIMWQSPELFSYLHDLKQRVEQVKEVNASKNQIQPQQLTQFQQPKIQFEESVVGQQGSNQGNYINLKENQHQIQYYDYSSNKVNFQNYTNNFNIPKCEPIKEIQAYCMKEFDNQAQNLSYMNEKQVKNQLLQSYCPELMGSNASIKLKNEVLTQCKMFEVHTQKVKTFIILGEISQIEINSMGKDKVDDVNQLQNVKIINEEKQESHFKSLDCLIKHYNPQEPINKILECCNMQWDDKENQDSDLEERKKLKQQIKELQTQIEQHEKDLKDLEYKSSRQGISSHKEVQRINYVDWKIQQKQNNQAILSQKLRNHKDNLCQNNNIFSRFKEDVQQFLRKQ